MIWVILHLFWSRPDEWRGLGMVKRLTAVTVGIGLLIAANGLTISRAQATEDRPNVPKCAEDETYLEGVGDFENGRWDRYVCAHPDAIVRDRIRRDYRNSAVYASARSSVCAHRRFWNREAGIRPSVSETCDGRDQETRRDYRDSVVAEICNHLHWFKRETVVTYWRNVRRGCEA